MRPSSSSKPGKCRFPPRHPDRGRCQPPLGGGRLSRWQAAVSAAASRQGRQARQGRRAPFSGRWGDRVRAAIGPGQAGCLLLTSHLVGRGWWVWHVTNVPGDLGCRGEHQLSWRRRFAAPLPACGCGISMSGSSLFRLFLLCERDKSNVLPVLDYIAVCCCLGPP